MEHNARLRKNRDAINKLETNVDEREKEENLSNLYICIFFLLALCAKREYYFF